MAKKAAANPQAREDAVLIRKSKDSQDERAQIENVRQMLQSRRLKVREELWCYAGKGVRRADIAKDSGVNALMSLVAKQLIGTIYIESRDRWGSVEVSEYFFRRQFLRQYGTKLYDLTNSKDLTEVGIVGDVEAVVSTHLTREELKKISQRTMRTKVNNLAHRGHWPSGPAPFGYGKACYLTDGRTKKDIKLWEWHPTSRDRGDLYTVKSGKLILAQSNIRTPPRSKTDDERPFVKLIPNRHEKQRFVKTVKLIFDLFTTQNVSCRSLAIKLNGAGHRYYDKPFNHSLIMLILRNPAYRGDTHYGKTQTADFFTMRADGGLVNFDEELKNGVYPERRHRSEAERFIKKKTHPPIIDPKVWKLAQAKLKRIESAKRYPARNPEYYLRPLLTCGHCGKSMSGRTEKHPTTQEKVIVYFCPTYLGARSKGIEPTCKSYRITHDEAEKLLLDHVKQANIDFDPKASDGVRQLADRQWGQLGADFNEAEERALDLMQEGIEAFSEYLDESGLSAAKRKAFKEFAQTFYRDAAAIGRNDVKRRGADWNGFKKLVQDAEGDAIAIAKERVKTLQSDYNAITVSWAQANARMKAVLQAQLDEIEPALDIWEPRVRTISERLEEVRSEYRETIDKATQLEQEWPRLEAAERSEALQRIFTKVTLYWDSKFHPSPDRPTREKKTDRNGRWSHTLNEEKIQWGLTPDLGGAR